MNLEFVKVAVEDRLASYTEPYADPLLSKVEPESVKVEDELKMTDPVLDVNLQALVRTSAELIEMPELPLEFFTVRSVRDAYAELVLDFLTLEVSM